MVAVNGTLCLSIFLFRAVAGGLSRNSAAGQQESDELAVQAVLGLWLVQLDWLSLCPNLSVLVLIWTLMLTGRDFYPKHNIAGNLWPISLRHLAFDSTKEATRKITALSSLIAVGGLIDLQLTLKSASKMLNLTAKLILH